MNNNNFNNPNQKGDNGFDQSSYGFGGLPPTSNQSGTNQNLNYNNNMNYNNNFSNPNSNQYPQNPKTPKPQNPL